MCSSDLWLLDRLLALDPFASGAPADAPIVSTIEIDAPQGLVWRALSDIPAQPLWMREMKAVRLEGDGPVGVGTRGEADVRIAGIGVTDPVEVSAWEPPSRFAIRHLGHCHAVGAIALVGGEQDERPAIGGHAGGRPGAAHSPHHAAYRSFRSCMTFL